MVVVVVVVITVVCVAGAIENWPTKSEDLDFSNGRFFVYAIVFSSLLGSPSTVQSGIAGESGAPSEVNDVSGVYLTRGTGSAISSDD